MFKLVLKIFATGKHNVQLNSPHSNSLLPSYVRLEYFVNCQVIKHPRQSMEIGKWKICLS